RGLKNIQQRILAACRLEPVEVRHIEAYIEHRLGIVGWDHDPEFDTDLFLLIQKLSQGLPREINHLMGRLLLYGALEEKHRLTDEDLWIVAQELDREQRRVVDIQEIWLSHQWEKALIAKEVPDIKVIGFQTGSSGTFANSAASSADPPIEITDEEEAQAEGGGSSEGVADSTPLERDFQEPSVPFQDGVPDNEFVGPLNDKAAAGETQNDMFVELPSMHLDDDLDLHRHSQPPTGVDDLLGERSSAGLGTRWRWFFYPLLSILLLISFLVPKPIDLRMMWGDFRRQMQGQTALPVEIQPVHRHVEPVSQPLVQEDEAPDESDLMPDPMLTEVQQPVPIAPIHDQAKALPTQPPEVTRQIDSGGDTVEHIQIEPDNTYLIRIDGNTGEPVGDSHAPVIASLNAAMDNSQTLIVITGLTQNAGKPVEQVREALRQAEILADYLVEHGVSRRQISIEGSVPDVTMGDPAKAIQAPSSDDQFSVNLKVTSQKLE
ncbi:MAG: hypothetical protein ACK2T3_15905, partial [Candidatus Promineifilaceae bacterium]